MRAQRGHRHAFEKPHFADHAIEGHLRGSPLGNLALEMSTQDEELRTRLEAIFSQRNVYFERLLRDALDAGAIRAVAPRRTARALAAYLEGVVMLAKVSNDPMVLMESEAQALRLTGFTIKEPSR